MKGILFLCVANSARSQMAEGIARSLAPADIKIWSAGSRPTIVRPDAITALKEIGIDISGHHAKSVDEIQADQVDAVITLCAEEECPLFLGKATRLHWGLPDPAAVTGNTQERLNAFRQTRDELYRHLKSFLKQQYPMNKETVMEIKVLGPGCPNCKTLAKRTEEAVHQLGIDAQIIKVTDYPEMMKYDMLQSPGLVINEKLVMSGRVPTVAEITTLLANGQLEETEPAIKCGCKKGCCS